MNTNHQAATQVATMMASTRKIAIAAGVCYLITHVTSVGAQILYGPILNNAGYITGSGPDAQVLVGAFFEVILALANIGTAVVLFPVVKRQHEGIALGYVGLRTLEAGIIAVGVVPLLAVVTLHTQHLTGIVGTDTGTLVIIGNALVGSYKWISLIGPGLVCGTNTVLMAFLMYRSGLVPQFIPVLGLVGGPLVFAYNAAACLEVAITHAFDVPRYSTIQFCCTILAEFLTLRLLLDTFVQLIRWGRPIHTSTPGE